MMNPWHFTVLGYQAGLARPEFLVLLLVGLVLGLYGIREAFKRRDRLRQLLVERQAEIIAPGVSQSRPALQSGFYGLGLMLLSFALAQPQCGSKTELVKRRGIDLVVALDVSKSMLARDIAPSRLDRAKLELTSLLDELKGDRVGVVIFAGDAFIQCPLTTDYAAAKMFLRAVEPNQLQRGGTNLGAALRVSQQMLANADRGASADKVIVLLSDGEDLGGEVDGAASELDEAGVKVLAVGIGSEQGEPIPVLGRAGEITGYQKDEHGLTVMSKLNRNELTKLAQATGGEFFYEPNAVNVRGVAARIDAMKKSELETRLTVKYDERFQPYAFVGLALLVTGMAIPASRRRKTA